MYDGLVWSLRKLQIYWDFSFFTKNGLKKRYHMSSSCDVLLSEDRAWQWGFRRWQCTLPCTNCLVYRWRCNGEGYIFWTQLDHITKCKSPHQIIIICEEFEGTILEIVWNDTKDKHGICLSRLYIMKNLLLNIWCFIFGLWMWLTFFVVSSEQDVFVF